MAKNQINPTTDNNNFNLKTIFRREKSMEFETSSLMDNNQFEDEQQSKKKCKNIKLENIETLNDNEISDEDEILPNNNEMTIQHK
ncbi:unnamed protein product [Didymodactylos carnosus]|uniref:Uncharacterized protein n=1 Tax=Didymodactylos carnosus TaxID=1234261 RepID=A0A8S2Q605_9BILA|nr:unnamed protein product [Didymodactylos carnosus]CAF4086606.1 unnamed protein product [Didymodactylos carnosus]